MSYVGWAGNIGDDKLIMLVRLALLFATPQATLYWYFTNNRRENVSRFLACLLADGVILGLPISVPYDTTARAWILAISAIGLACLPGILPFLIFPEVGRQQRLRRGLYVFAGFLLIIGMLWS